MQSQRRVVVTGLGTVNPVGLNVADSWKSILEGQSGVVSCDFPVDDLACQFYASVKNFNHEAFGITNKEARRVDQFILYGMAAAKEAMEDANLDVNDQNTTRIGVAVGSGIGGLHNIDNSGRELDANGPRRISPFFIPSTIINMVAGSIAIKHHLKGPNISIVTACTTGTHSIGIAGRLIAYGDADVMLAGGAEQASTRLGMSGFSAAKALSTRNEDPAKASRPWDRDRDGFVLGDGAGVLVLEEYEHAKARGAKIYGELLGFGMSGDAYHMTAPDVTGSGFIACMQNALKDGGLQPSDIDYINAHGTSTPTGDRIEAAAIAHVFSDTLDKLSVSSTKSMTGHLLGAAGAIEAIFSLMAIKDQILPPTINLDNLDEACDFKIDLVPGKAKEKLIKTVLSNSFGFGGTNGTIIFSSMDE